MKKWQSEIHGDKRQPQTPAVLFDGSCPLCRREIAHYRRRKNADLIQWIDASGEATGLQALGISQQAAMSRFHVRDGDGCWHTGADGFLYLWSLLPAYQWLASIVRTCRLEPRLAWGYEYFLRWRNGRQCSDNECTG